MLYLFCFSLLQVETQTETGLGQSRLVTFAFVSQFHRFQFQFQFHCMILHKTKTSVSSVRPLAAVLLLQFFYVLGLQQAILIFGNSFSVMTSFQSLQTLHSITKQNKTRKTETGLCFYFRFCCIFFRQIFLLFSGCCCCCRSADARCFCGWQPADSSLKAIRVVGYLALFIWDYALF